MNKFVAEIVNDELSDLIARLVVERKPEVIIEIGSGDGMGSTQAFIKGVEIAGIQEECTMYCMEVVPDRFDSLRQVSKDYSFIAPLHASSVSLGEFMTIRQIDKFIDEHPEFGIAEYGKPTVRGWLMENVETIEMLSLPTNKLRELLAYDQQKNKSLMVFIDGSAFTGLAEYHIVKSVADTIIMDDTIDIKCWDAYQDALNCGGFELIAENKTLRNGYAAFRRKS